MVRGDVHSAPKIETVSCKTLHPRIESEVLTVFFPGIFDHPINQGFAVTTGAVRISCHQVINIKSATGEKQIQNAKPSYGANNTVHFEEDKLIPFFPLVEHSGGEIDGFDMGPQLAHNRCAPANLFRGAGKTDFPRDFFGFRHRVFIARTRLRSSTEFNKNDKKLVGHTDLLERLSFM